MEKERFSIKDVFRLLKAKINNRERNRARAYQKKLDKLEKKKSS